MFHIHSPLSLIEVRARLEVYREYLQRYPNLERVPVGADNDMIMLAKDAATGEATAILWATGRVGQRVVFPRHRHGKGEFTICLAGHYGEILAVNEVPDDLLGGTRTLAEFTRRHPGVVEVGVADAQGVREVILKPGARWSMASSSEHKPFGFIGEGGVLMAQIYWGGHNEITEPNFSPVQR